MATSPSFFPEGSYYNNGTTTLFAVWRKIGFPTVSITFDAVWGNPLSISNITTEELASVLNVHSRYNAGDTSGSWPWLGNLSPTFIAAGSQYGINPVFLASLATSEGGWWEYDVPNTGGTVFYKKNIMGWMIAGTLTPVTFDSYESCINTVAKNMIELYFTPNQGYAKSNGHFDVNGNLIGSAWMKTYCGDKDERYLTSAFFNAVKNKLGGVR